ncbi:MAG: tyrosine-type recombinase/integrase [Nevskiales bacterium]
MRRSAQTADRKAAQELYDRLKAERWRVDRLGEKPKYTWDDAVVQWFKEKDHKATLDKDKSVFRWLDRYLRGVQLAKIDRATLCQIAEAKAAQTGPSNANRTMALVRAVLRRAWGEWEWIERAPKVPMYVVRNRRVRWITREEADRLIHFLPPHQAAMARFALATGLRQRNVCRLAWKDVDLARQCCWIHPDQAKARKAISVPLNAEAVAVLRERQGVHEEFVFTYEGNPVWQVNTKSWRKAVKQAGLEDFRWHDLRHTWASWHVQAGTPLYALQEMGAWASVEMVRRYAHLSAAHLLPHAERIVSRNVVVKNHIPDTVTQGKVVYLRNHQRKLVATGGLEPPTSAL